MRAKAISAIINNRHTPINLLAYSTNRFSAWPTVQRAERSAIARVERFWKNKSTPTTYAIGDRFEDGLEVRTAWPDGQTHCDDTEEWPGKHIGYLKKIKNVWTTVSTPPPVK